MDNNRYISYNYSLNLQVFASNYFGNCKNEESQVILHSGSKNLFAGGAGFENPLYFYCYGLKISDHIHNSHLGLQQLQFELEGNSVICISSRDLRKTEGHPIIHLWGHHDLATSINRCINKKLFLLRIIIVY